MIRLNLEIAFSVAGWFDCYFLTSRLLPTLSSTLACELTTGNLKLN